MNEKIEVPTMKVPPLKKICMTIGQLPASYIESMSYYEMLVWFIHYLRDDIIPVVNANGEATQELQELYVELQDYVNNYFDNLDVQEEIDHKLDEMVEEGSLQEIIADYLNSKAIFGFDNVESMVEATNLIDGSYARTLGYYTLNDGGEGLYKITDTQDSNEIQIELNSGLYATLIIKDNNVNFDCLGAKGDDNTFDNSTILTTAITYCVSKGYDLFIPAKTYYFSNIVDLYSIGNTKWDYFIKIKGVHQFLSIFNFGTSLSYGLKYTNSNYKNFIIENMTFECTTKNNNITLLHLENSPKSQFKNVILKNCNYGLYQTNCWLSDYDNITCTGVNYGIYIDGFNYTVGFCDALKFNRLYLGGNPEYAGLYLKGCVNANLFNIDAENSNKGNAIIFDMCKNILIDGFYCEGFSNQQPIKITTEDFTSLDRIPTNITINNINCYNSVAIIRVEACLCLTINNIFYRNKIYNQNITSYDEYPLLISFKIANDKYIGTIYVNGTNYIRPVSPSTSIAPYLAYNNLISMPNYSSLSNYHRTFTRGQKINFTSDNVMYVITDDGTYSTNPTATITNSANSFYGTLSASDSNIFVGQFVTIDTKKYRVIKIVDTTIYFDTKIVAAHTNEAITTCNPSYKVITYTA